MLKLSSPGDTDDAEGEAEPMKYARHCRAARAAAYYDARQMRMFISGDRSSWPRSDKIARWAAPRRDPMGGHGLDAGAGEVGRAACGRR